MPPISETPNGWLGSAERSEALKLAAARGTAARATGLLDGDLDEELRASFERTTHQVARYLNVPVGLFSLLDGECQMIIATNGVNIPEILPAEGSMCVHVRDSGRDVIVDDLTRHELGDLASNMTAAGANAYMGTPVFSPDGHPIGSLCAIDLPSRSWEPNDLDLLRSLAEGLTDKIALIQARARAEASEARMAATIEAIPNVVYVFEPDGRIGYVSPLVEAQFGLARESLLGFGYLRHLNPEDARQLLDGIRARTDEPAGFTQEFRLRDGDGVERELLSSGRPFRDVDGAVGYIVSTTEIGHLRETERALALERGRLEGVLEALPHVVVLSNPERGVEYVSPQARAILGYEPEALLGFGVYDLLIHPDDQEEMRAKRRGWLSTPEGFQHEFRGRHADGREMRMLLRGFPLPSRESVTHSHVITFTDLEAIRAAEAETAEERRKLAGILDVLPTGLLLADELGRITRANDEARRMFGDGLEPGRPDAGGRRAYFVEADGTETPLTSEN
ncbi:PAS domain S-box protein, partial [bacterium]